MSIFSHELEQYLSLRLVQALRQPEPPIHAITEACAQLEAVLATVVPFVPAPVVALTMAQPGRALIEGQYLNGTIIYASVAGFAGLSAQLAALGRRGSEEISSLVRHVFGALFEEITAHGGSVINFSGDTLIAFFDAAQLGFQHPVLACAAALGMQRRMAAFSSIDLVHGNAGLFLRVGVQTGSVFIVEMGDASHVELVVAGRTVNRAIMAQESAAPGEIVVAGATLPSLPGAHVEQKLTDLYLLGSFSFKLEQMVIPQPSWRREIPSLAAVERLLQRIKLLRSYLPSGLADRFAAMQAQEGEFRPVTVLFDDFSPISKLMTLLELPALIEDDMTIIGRVMNTYFVRTQAIMHQYGGAINRIDTLSYGNRLMALFGAPVANEDDPARAVHAAIALRDDLDGINRSITTQLQQWAATHQDQQLLLRMRRSPLRQRSGIASGVVFAGVVGTPQRHGYTVIGQTVDLAMRLMAVAQVGKILLASGTYRLAQPAIHVQPEPPLVTPGEARSVAVFRVAESESAAAPAQATGQQSPLIGRQHELDSIQAAADLAFAEPSTGQVVALVGEPGIGKTRLANAALERVRAAYDQAVFVREICHSYEQTTPYAVAARLVQQLLHLSSYPSMADLQEQLDLLVPQWSRFAPLVAAALGWPHTETASITHLSAEQRNERLRDVITAVCLAVAKRQPLALVIDDVHWADHSSLRLLEQLAAEITDQPLLVLLMYRREPHIAAPWQTLSNATIIALGELSPAESQDFVHALLRTPAPDALTQFIEQAHGSPLFLEEMISYLLQYGALQRKNNQWFVVPFNGTAIPSKIEQLITARIDRLDPVSRALVQIAAVVGQHFSETLLDAVAADDALVRPSITPLLAEALIVPDDRPASYRFKHAMVREVIYESMLFANRREIHARVAAAIEQEYADQIDAYNVVLAQHYLSAEQHDHAFPLFFRAAQQAQAAYANQEAIVLYQQALATAPWRAGTQLPADTRLASAVYSNMGDVLALIGEYPRARDAYEFLLHMLADNADEPATLRAAVQRKIGSTFEQQGSAAMALHWFNAAAETIAAAPADAAMYGEHARILSDTGWIYFRQNNFDQALEYLEQSLLVANMVPGSNEQERIFNRLGGVAYARGDWVAAQQYVVHSLEASQRNGNISAQASALGNLGILTEAQDTLRESVEYSRESLRLREQIGDQHGSVIALINLGAVLFSAADYDQAEDTLKQALERAQSIRDVFHQMLALLNLSRVYISIERWEDAEQMTRRGQFVAAQLHVQAAELDCSTLLAEIALGRGDVATAASMYQSAEVLVEDATSAEAGRRKRLAGRIAWMHGQADAAVTLLHAAEAIFLEQHNLPEARRTRAFISSVGNVSAKR